jgi:hypothetical protein
MDGWMDDHKSPFDRDSESLIGGLCTVKAWQSQTRNGSTLVDWILLD